MPDPARDWRNARDAIQEFIDANFPRLSNVWGEVVPGAADGLNMQPAKWRQRANEITGLMQDRTPAPDRVVTGQRKVDDHFNKKLGDFRDYLAGCVQ